jgi:hypothetical protein
MTAFDDNGRPTLAVSPAAHDEFGEILEAVQSWPTAERLRLFEHVGLSVPTEAAAAAHRAFELGRETGREEGQRALLQRVFDGAATGQAVLERVAVIAFVEVHPDAAPATVADLAALSGLSERTAHRRVAEARAPAPADLAACFDGQ